MEGVLVVGLVEMIVDIIIIGFMFQVNNLKILVDGVILKSQVNLVVLFSVDWLEIVLIGVCEIFDWVVVEESVWQVKLVKVVVDDWM